MTDATKYASVTAILSGGVPKPALPRWAAKMVAEAAVDGDWLLPIGKDEPHRAEVIKELSGAPWRTSSEAADLGSLVHAHVEAMNLGRQMGEWPLPVRQHRVHFEAWLAQVQPEIEAAEMRVYSRRHGYAGTLDMLARVDGRLLVVDVKTGKGVYPETALQLAAYARADFCVADQNHPGSKQVTPQRGRRWYEWHGPREDELPMPKVDGAAILHLRPDGFGWYPNVDIGEPVFEAFLAACQVDAYCQMKPKDVLGARVEAEAVAA